METEFNTIKDALSDMTKVGLDRLRKFSGYKIKSNLKKAGLVDALEAALKADPVTFLNKLPIFDLILLRSACRTPQDSVAAFDALVDMNYIELFNIVNYDFDDGKGEEYIWGNEEFSNLFSPFIDDVIDDLDRKGISFAMEAEIESVGVREMIRFILFCSVCLCSHFCLELHFNLFSSVLCQCFKERNELVQEENCYR